MKIGQLAASVVLVVIGGILLWSFPGKDPDPGKGALDAARYSFSLVIIAFASGLVGVKPWWAGLALGVVPLAVSTYETVTIGSAFGFMSPVVSFAYPCIIGVFFCFFGMLMRSRDFRHKMSQAIFGDKQ
jgi:hypothetical protein